MVNDDTFVYIWDEIRSFMTVWKSKDLTFAGQAGLDNGFCPFYHDVIP